MTFAPSMYETPSFRTAAIVEGSGPAVLFIHGSGPGATALANWRDTLPALPDHRCVALDLSGFGGSSPRTGLPYTVFSWSQQCFELMDTLGIDRICVVGNSLGGRIAMEMALERPERIDRLVLMGSGGLLVQPTPALAKLREYTPSPDNMRGLMEHCFLYDPSLVSETMVQERYATSAATFDVYNGMFADRERVGLILAAERIAQIAARTAVVHGRDDKVIPAANGVRLAELIPDADLHLLARCGHWAMFERRDAFNALIAEFLSDGQR